MAKKSGKEATYVMSLFRLCLLIWIDSFVYVHCIVRVFVLTDPQFFYGGFEFLLEKHGEAGLRDLLRTLWDTLLLECDPAKADIFTSLDGKLLSFCFATLFVSTWPLYL